MSHACVQWLIRRALPLGAACTLTAPVLSSYSCTSIRNALFGHLNILKPHLLLPVALQYAL